MESEAPAEETKDNTWAQYLVGKKFDILWNGKNQFAIYFKFNEDGSVESNQTMFNNAPWIALSNNQFTLGRKNTSKVLWQFKDTTYTEAFRTDKPLYGMRFSKIQ